MTDIDKLNGYLNSLKEWEEILKKLNGKNKFYNTVSVRFGEGTTIIEKQYNPESEQFHEIEFLFSDIDNMRKKIEDKIRYQKAKKEEIP